MRFSLHKTACSSSSSLATIMNIVLNHIAAVYNKATGQSNKPGKSLAMLKI